MDEEFTLNHVTDMLKLTEDQFARMLPDLYTWYVYSKLLEAAGGESTGLVWRDDNRPGVITGVDCTDPKTGEQFTIDLDDEAKP
ncbi:hypothetical protein C8C93_2085 [Acidovorax sp. 93]|uniref:hypothetical protein n=1 Tax=Acidovorax sp. 93 TaxID=2135632 RepID=UPI000EB5F801|nr:hypothetical protein [Acidovorax sp. 93]RKR26835.1 hypothetical protein C8C93_2085 [Acidovorax sp. 93]